MGHQHRAEPGLQRRPDIGHRRVADHPGAAGIEPTAGHQRPVHLGVLLVDDRDLLEQPGQSRGRQLAVLVLVVALGEQREPVAAPQRRQGLGHSGEDLHRALAHRQAEPVQQRGVLAIGRAGGAQAAQAPAQAAVEGPDAVAVGPAVGPLDLVEHGADLLTGHGGMLDVVDERLDRALEQDVVLPEGVVGVEDQVQHQWLPGRTRSRMAAQPPLEGGSMTWSACVSASGEPPATTHAMLAASSSSTSLAPSPTASTRPGSSPWSPQNASTPLHLLTPGGRTWSVEPPYIRSGVTLALPTPLATIAAPTRPSWTASPPTMSTPGRSTCRHGWKPAAEKVSSTVAAAPGEKATRWNARPSRRSRPIEPSSITAGPRSPAASSTSAAVRGRRPVATRTGIPASPSASTARMVLGWTRSPASDRVPSRSVTTSSTALDMFQRVAEIGVHRSSTLPGCPPFRGPGAVILVGDTGWSRL